MSPTSCGTSALIGQLFARRSDQLEAEEVQLFALAGEGIARPGLQAGPASSFNGVAPTSRRRSAEQVLRACLPAGGDLGVAQVARIGLQACIGSSGHFLLAAVW